MSLVDTVTDDNQRITNLDGAAVGNQEPRETEEVIPEKFKGKSAADIARSYVELEKELGRTRNDVGEMRSLTDRLLQIEEKRVRDLEGAGGKAEEDFNIDPAQLLSNPRETLEKWYEVRRNKDPVFQEVQQRLARIEGHVVEQEIKSAHEDADQITADPEFHNWVKGHPVRLNIAQSAIQHKDVQSLDYLLTEYKRDKGASAAPERRQSNPEVETVRRITTEKASSGSPTDARKTSDQVFSRRKLIKLKIENPEEYSAMQDQILRAYAEGRVVD